MDLWTYSDSRLGKMFIMSPEKPSARFSVMTVADLLQLPPIRGKIKFSQFSYKYCMKHLLCL